MRPKLQKKLCRKSWSPSKKIFRKNGSHKFSEFWEPQIRKNGSRPRLGRLYCVSDDWCTSHIIFRNYPFWRLCEFQNNVFCLVCNTNTVIPPIPKSTHSSCRPGKELCLIPIMSFKPNFINEEGSRQKQQYIFSAILNVTQSPVLRPVQSFPELTQAK